MYWDYMETVSRAEQIGAVSFSKIARSLTATDQRAKKAVDYVSGVLIQDHFSWMHEVVSA